LAVLGPRRRHRRRAGPRCAQQRLRDLAQEAARERRLGAPVQVPSESAAQIKTVARTRDADVAKAPLLGHLVSVGLLEGPGVWQQTLLDADQEDDRELQP